MSSYVTIMLISTVCALRHIIIFLNSMVFNLRECVRYITLFMNQHQSPKVRHILHNCKGNWQQRNQHMFEKKNKKNKQTSFSVWKRNFKDEVIVKNK